MPIVSLPDAGPHPGAMMVHLFYADAADVAVAGPGGAVDVAGHAELDLVDFLGVGDDVGDLNVALDVLVLGD